ncbi:MAG: MFS transporter [Lachnospiraceae bacterium]|nr:MFS transporter [Lachnospiraceae bacterium]
MSSNEELKPKVSKKDRSRSRTLLIISAILLLIFCWNFQMTPSEAVSMKTVIDLGYNAKQGPDGMYYVLDSSHERLLCFDGAGKMQFSIENPSDGISDLLYIDDFYVTGDSIYLSASEWAGMALGREAVVKYDLKGNFLEIITDFDYSEVRTNKHKIYGLSEYDGYMRFVEADTDSLVIGRKEIDYPNAFNAVSDALFIGTDVYVLDKDGTLYKFADGSKDAEVVYSVAGSDEEQEGIVPYRLGADRDGNIYYTDIHNCTVRRIDSGNHSSEVVVDATDSLTVNFSQNSEMMLVDYDGLHIIGDGGTRDYLELDKNIRTIVIQIIWIIGILVCSVTALMILVRVGMVLFKRKHTTAQIVSYFVIGTVAFMAVLVGGMLMTRFSDSYKDKIEEQVECAAYMIANQIDADEIEQVRTVSDFSSDAYRHICEVMDQSFPMDIDFYNQVYCNILKKSDDGGPGYSVAYLDQSVGSYFPLDDVESAEVDEVYETGRTVWNQDVEDISGSYLSVKVPIKDDDGVVRGCVAVGVETYIINDTLSAMLLDILLPIIIILLLIWLISVEALSFASNIDIYKKNLQLGEREVMPGHMVRILVFLVFSAYNMSATFLPVYLLKGAEIFPENMREMAGALPLTVNIFLIGVMSLFCAGLVRKFGIKKILIVSACCSMAGNLLIFIAPVFPVMCLGLILDGIGVGLITNTVYVMLTYLKDPVNRNWGLTIYNGACLSGINFGMILGSFLAVYLGQRFVFLIVGLVWVGMVFLTRVLVKQIEEMISVEADDGTDKSEISIWAFIKHKVVLGFIILIQNPYILFSGFVFYFVPLFCDELGYNETICSLMIMLYSQIAVIGTESLTERVSKKFGNSGMYLAIGMNIAAIMTYAVLGNMMGMIIALVLMGLSAAFGKPVQQDYYLQMEPVKQYGEDKAMGIYNFSENIGESLGPIVMGRIMGFANRLYSVAAFCGIIAGCSGLHALICGKKKEIEEKS